MKTGSVRSLMMLSLLAAAGCVGQSPSFDVIPTQKGFQQEIQYNNKMDVLWIVDDSASMDGHRKNIAKQFHKFIDAFAAKDLDFNIAITTTDMRVGKGPEGAFIGNPSIINGKHSEAKGRFGKNMEVGASSGVQEQGLLALKTALSPELLTTLNEGFLRKDATLVVIFLSDEEDHSVPGDVNYYVEFLDKLKPKFPYGARGWVANMIGITDENGKCLTGGKIPEVGHKYMKLAQISGGQIESVCANDLAAVVSRLQKRIVSMITEYHLDRPPQIDTIRVWIDGRLVPKDEENGWTYEDEGYVIRFHGDAIPAATSSVHIEFKKRASK